MKQTKPMLIKPMLRVVVSKVLYDKHPSILLNKEIDVCNKFIDDYNKVLEIMLR